ncbi:MAG TPA: molybdopterin-dependent oxidoreductase, partial [Actinomycetota bacterium]|nr:molybdopterin-dependent oxidoreductase [Actinomycetota bacterium]
GGASALDLTCPPVFPPAGTDNEQVSEAGTRWRRALAGVLGTATLVFMAAVLHTISPSVPFLPSVIAQAWVRTPPASIDSVFIDALGHWAARLALIGTALGLALSGALLGQVIPWAARRLRRPEAVAGAVVFLPLWALSVAIYPHPAPPALARWPFGAATFPLFLLAGALAGLALARLERAAGAQAGPEVDRGRRYVLGAIGLGAAGVFLGVSNLGSLIRPRPDPGDQLLRVAGLTPAAAPPPDPAFDDITGLSSRITPNGSFYVVDESLIDPDIDPGTWRLSIGGLVDRPYALSYPQLKLMPLVERFQTLECISNKVGGDLISTARWVGVPLRHLLDRAGVDPKATEVVFRAAGGYSDSLPIEHAMDQSTLVAIGMNGHVLPRAHGFPARLLSVGTYGMKNPKWLTSIEVIRGRYVGFWEARGWNASAPIKTFSRIDTPNANASRTVANGAGRALAAGIAFGGDREIERVEVSADGGQTWNQAQLEAALSRYTWRRWRYSWTPFTPREIVVRAIDGSGSVQIQRPQEPFPSGSTGYDSARL